MPGQGKRTGPRPEQSARRGVLGRLARNTSGNTLAIMGAALIPLTAMIGSGVDMSRAYMAKTRLQSACDAAALAGRRVMTADTLDANVTAEATKFFNFNFPQGLYQTAAFTPVVTRPEAGTVKVAVDTSIPTSVMSLFGFTSLPLQVDCEASQNFVNTDIVLVLDTTGSMKCLPSESSCNTNRSASERSGSKIQALRDAVMALYDELAPVQAKLEASGLRLRYGIVPYSSTVNVGSLIYAQNPSYIVDNWTYQSRQGQNLGAMTRRQCSRTGGISSNGQCYKWTYKPLSLDVSTFKTGVSVTNPTELDGSTSKWEGCIEERDTTNTITGSSGYSIPANAYDLNIDLIPSSNATRWRPQWPDVEYYRTSSSSGYSYSSDLHDSGFDACPSKAVRLTAWTRNALQSYVNGLQAVGGTYHDIGMIWGARLISSAGIFADGADTYKGMPVAKHIIFMTDGDMQPNSSSYSAYGVEDFDQRIGGSTSGYSAYLARHNQRFRMICNATKGMNVSVWVIAFATTANSTLTECASNASQVSTIMDRDALIAKFTEIGKNIGSLRLTQ